jgi:hypothetical protein
MSNTTDIALAIAEEVEQAYLDSEFEDEAELVAYIQEKTQELAESIQEEVEMYCGNVFTYLREDESMRREDEISDSLGEIYDNYKATRESGDD